MPISETAVGFQRQNIRGSLTIVSERPTADRSWQLLGQYPGELIRVYNLRSESGVVEAEPAANINYVLTLGCYSPDHSKSLVFDVGALSTGDPKTRYQATVLCNGKYTDFELPRTLIPRQSKDFQVSPFSVPGETQYLGVIHPMKGSGPTPNHYKGNSSSFLVLRQLHDASPF